MKQIGLILFVVLIGIFALPVVGPILIMALIVSLLLKAGKENSE